MNLTLQALFTIIPILLLLEAIYSGSEIAILSADRISLKTSAQKGKRGASVCLLLLQTPEKILSTTLLVNNLCMIGITALVTLYFLEHHEARAEFLAVATASPLIVLLGEFIPKTIFQRYADRVAPTVSRLIVATYYVFYPITKLLSLYSHRIAVVIAPIEELIVGKKRTTRDEIQLLLSDTKQSGEAKNVQKRMLRRIFEFKDSEAKHALIPLFKVEAIEKTATVKEAIELFQKNRHSRMPVYSERIDNVVGFVELFDLFAVNDLSVPLSNFMTSAHYAAEMQSLDDLMLTMHQEDTKMTVVVDEYGGAIGIITFEDIVEEIVGEIYDEYDSGNMPFKALGENRWLVQGRMEIQAFAEHLKVQLPEGDYETVAGFLLQQFGRIPEPKDELFFNTEGRTVKFSIRQATDRRIELVLVEIITDNTGETR